MLADRVWRPRIPLHVEEGLLINDHATWAWAVVPLVTHPAIERTAVLGEVQRHIRLLNRAQRGHWHLSVLPMPLSPSLSTVPLREVREQPFWRHYLDRQGAYLARSESRSRIVLMGRKLGDRREGGWTTARRAAERMVGAEGTIPAEELERWRRQRDRWLLECKSQVPNMIACPAGVLRWTVWRAYWRGQELTVPNPPLDDLATEGDEARSLINGVVQRAPVGRGAGYVRLGDRGNIYCSFLTLPHLPHGKTFEGGFEWLFEHEKLPFPVEAQVRFEVLPTPAAKKVVANAERDAKAQQAHIREARQTPPDDLDETILVAKLERDRLEKEQGCHIRMWPRFAVWADSERELEERRQDLIGRLSDLDLRVEPARGDQMALWKEAMPGDEVTVGWHGHTVPPETLCGSMYMGSNGLGDPVGAYIGVALGSTTGVDSRVAVGKQPVFEDQFLPANANLTTSRKCAQLWTGDTGMGKALALDTPLPTPTGWTTMGDVRVGDTLFDEEGRPTTVLSRTPVMHGRECFEVEFSDGSVIVADADHRWLTSTFACRVSARRAAARSGLDGSAPGPSPRGTDQTWKRAFPQVVTTRQILATLRTPWGAANHAIPVAQPVQCPGIEASMDPYVLGVWLGDGDAIHPRITTADPEVIENIRGRGYRAWPVAPFQFFIARPGSETTDERTDRELALRAEGASVLRIADSLGVSANTVYTDLQARAAGRRRQRGFGISIEGELRALGVLGRKHIPPRVLRAPVDFRLDLLRGLMDSDGYVSKSGSCQLVVTSERLARDVLDLVLGLGIKASLRSRPAMLDGRQCGTAYAVNFTTDKPVCGISRKSDRQRAGGRPTQRLRYIVAVRPIPSVPVRCITVDSPSHLYLAGRSYIPTHNTIDAWEILIQLAQRGGTCVGIDPKRDMDGLEDLGLDNFQRLLLDEHHAGLLNPFGLLHSSRERQGVLAAEVLQRMVNPQLLDRAGYLIENAAMAEAREPQPRMSNVARRIQAIPNPLANEIAGNLEAVRGMPEGQLLFADPPRDTAIEIEGRLTLVQFSGLQLPDRDITRPSLRQRLSLGLMTALTAFLGELMEFGADWIPKALLIDEAHLVVDSELETVITNFERMGRSKFAIVMIATQLLRDVVDRKMMAQIGVVRAYGSQDPGEFEAAARVFPGLSPELAQEWLSSLMPRQCLMRDRQNRVNRVLRDIPFPELLRLLDTSPEGKWRRAHRTAAPGTAVEPAGAAAGAR